MKQRRLSSSTIARVVIQTCLLLSNDMLFQSSSASMNPDQNLLVSSFVLTYHPATTRATRTLERKQNNNSKNHHHITFRRASTPSIIDQERNTDNDDDDNNNNEIDNEQGRRVVVPPTTYPLAPHTFAGMVEQRMIEKFGYEPVKRIVESWRLLDQEYIHDEYTGPADKAIHQYCHSYVPGLTVRPFWDTTQFDWCNKIASKYKIIKQEFDAVTSDMDQLRQIGNNIWTGALTEDASSYGVGWKTLVLMDRGVWDPTNVNLFPMTSKIIHESKIPCCEVFFASMEPNSNIQLHSDFTNFVLTFHLGLTIPYSGENKCRLAVGNETRQWTNGNVMLFDTSLMHDAINESDMTRYILMLRVWHPDLTPMEIAALKFTFNCLDNPNLVDADIAVRGRAEELIQQRMYFPDIAKSIKTGFGMTNDNKGGKSKNSKSKPKRK